MTTMTVTRQKPFECVQDGLQRLWGRRRPDAQQEAYCEYLGGTANGKHCIDNPGQRPSE